MIALGLLKENALPFGDIHWVVGTICSFFIFFWIFFSASKDGTFGTPISWSNQSRTFIRELEIWRWGRLSTVSRRKASFDGYRYQADGDSDSSDSELETLSSSLIPVTLVSVTSIYTVDWSTNWYPEEFWQAFHHSQPSPMHVQYSPYCCWTASHHLPIGHIFPTFAQTLFDSAQMHHLEIGHNCEPCPARE